MVVTGNCWLQGDIRNKQDLDLDLTRYDHHQKGFAEVFGHVFTTKLSSAGLIYKACFMYLFLITYCELLSVLL